MKCSAVDADDPRKIEVMCKDCYFISSKSIKEGKEHRFLDELEKDEANINEIELKIQQKSQKIKDYIERLKVEEKGFEDNKIEISIIRSRQDKYEALEKLAKHKQEIAYICQQIEEKDSSCFDLEIFTEEEKNNLEIDKKKAADLYKILIIKQNLNTKLLKTLETFNLNQNISKSKDTKQLAREEVLRNAYRQLNEEQKFYFNENSKLKDELNDLENDVAIKDDILKKARSEIYVIHDKGDIEEDALIELNKNLQDQQLLIQKLKHELKVSKLPQEPLTYSSCCKCSVF